MTKKSKTIIILAAAVSAALIVTIIILYMAMSKNSTVNTASIILIPLIVIIAVISFAFVIYKRNKRNEYTKDFSVEYYEAYENIQDAISNSNLTIAERKEVLADVTSMLYYAQQEKRDVSDVVGDDIEAYIDKVKDSFGYRSGILFYFINGALYLIMILSLLQAVNFFLHEEVTNFFDASMGWSIVPYMAALSFIIVPLVKSAMTKKKVGWTFVIPMLFVAAYIAIHEILHRVNIDAKWLAAYLDGEVVFITSWGRLAIITCIAGLGVLLKWYLRRRSVQRL